MKKLTRTLPITNVEIATVAVVNGKPELANVEILQFVGEKCDDIVKAKKLVDKKKGKGNNFTVIQTQVYYAVYEMEVERFIGLADCKQIIENKKE